MEEGLRDTIEELASSIRAQSKHLETRTYNSLLFTADIVDRYLEIELAEYAVGRTGFNLLFTLVLNGGKMTPTSISKKILRSKFAITKMMDTLEKRGLVKRAAIGNDRRTREVMITRKGLEMVRIMHDRERTRLGPEILSILNRSQLETFDIILRRIRQHINTMISERKELDTIS